MIWNRPRIYIAIIIGVIAILAIVKLIDISNERENFVANETQEPSQIEPILEEDQLDPSIANWQRYADESIASFNYPQDIFTAHTEKQIIPIFNSSVIGKSIVLTHTVNKQHCDLSGIPENCTPTTTDFELSFTTLNLPLSKIMQDRNVHAEVGSAGKYFALIISQGAEGEGMFHYLIALDEKRTVDITHLYIDQDIVGNYKNVADFITLKEQGEILQKIFSTLLVGDSSADTAYVNKRYGFGFSYESYYGPVNIQTHTMSADDNNGSCVARGFSIKGEFPYQPSYGFSATSNDTVICQKGRNSISTGTSFVPNGDKLLVFYSDKATPDAFPIVKVVETNDNVQGYIVRDDSLGELMLYGIILKPTDNFRYMIFNAIGNKYNQQTVNALSQLITSFYVISR